MTKKFIVTCDSSCDAGKEEVKKLDVKFISYTISSDKNSIKDLMDEDQNKKFYDHMKKGEVFKTSQINVEEYMEFFRKVYVNGLPIVHISLCEGLSNSINNAREAARNLKLEGIKVYVVDSTIACLGSYIITVEACKLRDEGKDAEETVDELINKAKYVNTFYTTDTLEYFARGGRISKASALLGSTFHVNVILNCNAVGKLKIFSKTLGQKKAFKKIVDTIKASCPNPEEKTLYCCHAQNDEGIKNLVSAVLNEVPFKNISIHSMGPTIGTHAGPGLLALFYLGKEKTDF